MPRPAAALASVHRPASAAPAGLLFLLHGRGVDEHDLAPLADALDPGGRLHVVCPRAPLALPPGGWHWYISRRVGFPDPETFMASYRTLGSWATATAEELGVPWGRTVLGGFSQGAVMCLGLAFGEGRPAPAGVLGFSGFMPQVPQPRLTVEGHRQVVAALAHGTLDPVIEVSFGRQARDWLTERELAVVYDESPVGHTIDPAVLPRRAAWLAELLD
ncbi:MAG: phospholipase [Actinobacteria bacterium]|nr:MAG: phospholipase [Actinomycetota bacterium]